MRTRDKAGLTLAVLASVLLGCSKQEPKPERPTPETNVELKEPIPRKYGLTEIKKFEPKYLEPVDYKPTE